MSFTLDGHPVEVAREDITLLEALREDLGVRSVKDGCSPQGQCGCCTVLVDGAARVSCVTPVRRVSGRAVTTVDGLPGEIRDRLVSSFVAHGSSQCGFCTPGIVCRLAALPASPPAPAQVDNSLLAHLCRCTGWRSIVDAAVSPSLPSATSPTAGAAARAALEGGVSQDVGPATVLGRGGFADDTAPAGCLVAVPMAGATRASVQTAEGWSVGSTLAEARAGAGKIQGRRSGQSLAYPVEVPPGDWDITLQTTWVEPAYLEPDASWCEPGGTPASPVANGGAFGGKVDSLVPAAARMLADHHGRPVRALYSREDVVRLGPKRPPAAAGVRLDGTGVLRLGVSAGSPIPSPAGSFEASAFPGLAVEDAPVAGPAVSSRIRAAGWAEAAVLTAAASAASAGSRTATVTTADGARATAAVEVDAGGWPIAVTLEVDAGDPLDETVLCSYLQGAAHMALGWVCSEGIATDEDGVPTDLTIRSFGVLRAKDTPPIAVTVTVADRADRADRVDLADRPPVRASDAAFAAVAAATWLAQGLPSRWPILRGTRR
ncbi:MAG TPA: 2Fe-2S iron-sulfur cluster-binding protein [Acidimicrobiales bacterium]|nr:2Fe-2S iron-sulfur cluster-binding protein [Acidimicrobiales bacterium]